MTGVDFLQNINDIDEDLLEEAMLKPAKKRIIPMTWVASAACLLLMIQIGMVGSTLFRRQSAQNTVVAFSLAQNSYEVPALNDYARYGLLESDVVGRSGLSFAPISRKDLGEKMGTVEIQDGSRLVKCTVYYHADYAGDDSICILEMSGGSLQIYVRKEQ